MARARVDLAESRRTFARGTTCRWRSTRLTARSQNQLAYPHRLRAPGRARRAGGASQFDPSSAWGSFPVPLAEPALARDACRRRESRRRSTRSGCSPRAIRTPGPRWITTRLSLVGMTWPDHVEGFAVLDGRVQSGGRQSRLGRGPAGPRLRVGAFGGRWSPGLAGRPSQINRAPGPIPIPPGRAASIIPRLPEPTGHDLGKHGICRAMQTGSGGTAETPLVFRRLFPSFQAAKLNRAVIAPVRSTP